MTTTARTNLTTKLAKGINSGIFGRDPSTKKLLLELATTEQVAAETALTVRVAAAEALIAGAKEVADAAALAALDTTLFVDGQLVALNSTGVLYRFNLGEATGSEDPPNTYDATDGGGVYHEAVANDVGIHLPVADIATLKAIVAAARSEGMLCLVTNNGAAMADIYHYDATSVSAQTLPGVVSPDDAIGRWFAVGVFDFKTYYDTLYAAVSHTQTASTITDLSTAVDAIVATKVLTPVADTAALAALDVAGVLTAGASCLVVDRGDGYAWRYRYVVGAVPNPDYGTIGGVRVYTAGTNGYWTPEDLPAYLLAAEGFDRQRLGALGGAVKGTASAWFLSSEGADVNGHGFTLDWDGAHPEEVVVTDAIKDLCLSVALTETYLNLAIVSQCAVANNARARVVYDDVAGAYCIVFPSDVTTAATAITAPAVANDISVGAKLALETGATGVRTLPRSRSMIDSALAHPAESGSSHADVLAATTALTTLPSKGAIATAILSEGTAVDFAVNDSLTVGADIYVGKDAPAAPFEFLRGTNRATSIAALVAEAAISGTALVKLTADGNNILAQSASAPQGPLVAGGGGNIALACSIAADATSVWDHGNMNESGAAPSTEMAHANIVVSAAMAAALAVGAGAACILLTVPFNTSAATLLKVSVRTTAGACRYDVTDLFMLDTVLNLVVVENAGVTHLVAGNILDVIIVA